MIAGPLHSPHEVGPVLSDLLDGGDSLASRSSVAAAENDLCRAYAAKARKRASGFITQAYTNVPIMYFFPGPTLAMVVAMSANLNWCQTLG